MEATVVRIDKAELSPSPHTSWLTSAIKKMVITPFNSAKSSVVGAAKNAKKIGQEDPRRIYHSLKVGLALTLVSIFYYVNPIFHGLGVSAMWAVLTVVVVMEYTVGGTLAKGLNRCFATMLAGALGLGAHHLAILAGDEGEPIVLGVLVFLLAAAATFSRFVPEIKKRYDYGVVIFILTFSLVTVSSYRTEDVVKMARERLSTIAVGVGCCLSTTMFVFPVWAGEDLHKLTGGNLDKLARFLQGLEANYFEVKDVVGEKVEGKPFLGSYKSVLNSKATEEALANFARWEPCHGKFSFRHPWSQYLKIGALSRQCAYSMDALATYITNNHKLQSTNSEFQTKIRAASIEMSSESSKALTELAMAIRTMTPPSTAKDHLATAMAAAEKVRAPMSDESVAVASDILRAATIASLLIQVVNYVQQTSAAVEELARLSKFKALTHKATVKPVGEVECPQMAITVAESD